jgi:TonB family protein
MHGGELNLKYYTLTWLPTSRDWISKKTGARRRLTSSLVMSLFIHVGVGFCLYFVGNKPLAKDHTPIAVNWVSLDQASRLSVGSLAQSSAAVFRDHYKHEVISIDRDDSRQRANIRPEIPSDNLTEAKLSPPSAEIPANTAMGAPGLAVVSLRDVSAAVASVSGAALAGGSIDRDNSIISSYLGQLLLRLESRKFYPPESERLREEGIVEVAFTLAKDGRILEAKIQVGSASSELNQAAVDTVRRLGRFRPIPDELSQSDLIIVVPFVYRLKS